MAYPRRVLQSTIITSHIGFADELVGNWPWLQTWENILYKVTETAYLDSHISKVEIRHQSWR